MQQHKGALADTVARIVIAPKARPFPKHKALPGLRAKQALKDLPFHAHRPRIVVNRNHLPGKDHIRLLSERLQCLLSSFGCLCRPGRCCSQSFWNGGGVGRTCVREQNLPQARLAHSLICNNNEHCHGKQAALPNSF